MPLLMAANAAPAITLSSIAAITLLLGVITALLGAVGRFLWRELKNNDEGHRHLRADIKKFETDVQKLLAGQARIEGLLEGVVGGGPHRG